MPKTLDKVQKTLKSSTRKARVRRPISERLEDLRSRREELNAYMQKRLQALDSKIGTIEIKYSKKLELEQLAAVPADELEREIQDAKARIRLIREAKKACK